MRANIVEKTLALILTVALVITMMPMPISAYASEQVDNTTTPIETNQHENTLIASGTCGENATWTLDENYILTIKGSGSMDDYTDAVESRGWAEYSTLIKKIVIEEGITATGAYAFDDMANLEEVTLPSTLTYIASKTFPVGAPIGKLNIASVEAYCNIEVGRAWWDSGCYPVSDYGTDVYLDGELITELLIPETVKKIREYAFYQWKSVEKITVEYGVEVVGSSAFSSTSITELSLPESVTEVGNTICLSCTSLKELTIPDSATTIGSTLIGRATPLEKISLPISYRATILGQDMGGGLPSIKTFVFSPGVDGTGFNYNTTSVTSYNSYLNTAWHFICTAPSNILTIVLEEGITHIGNYMFKDCPGIKELTIPSTVTSIGTEAIDSTVKLKVYHGTYGETFAKENGYSYELLHNYKKISQTDSNCRTQGQITYKCNASKCTETKYESLPLADHQFETAYTFDDGTEFGYCIYDCGTNNLSTGDCEEVVGSITDCCNWYLYDEKYLIITGAGDISDVAISPWENYNIEYCYIEEGITSIGKNLFANTDLSVIQIPGSLIDIDITAFTGCTNLEDIHISDENPSYRVSGNILTDATEETILLYFGDEEEKDIPSQYSSIGQNAFVSSEADTKVLIPFSLENIEAAKALANVKPYAYDNSYARRFLESNGIDWVSRGMYQLPWEDKEVHYQMAYHMLVEYLKDMPGKTVTTQFTMTNTSTDYTLSMSYIDGIVEMQLVGTVKAAKYYTYLSLDESGLIGDSIYMECWLNGTVNNGYTGVLTTEAEDIEYNKTRLWDFEPGMYMGSLNLASCTVQANTLLDTLLFNVSSDLLDDAGLNITDLGFINFYANSEGTIHLNPVKSGGVNPDCEADGKSDDFLCPICGAYKEGTFLGASGHTEVIDKAINSTCTESGLTEGSHCSTCGEVFVAQEVIDKKGHSYETSYTIDKKATKSQDGSMSKHCTRDSCTSKESVIVIPKISTEKLSSTLYTYDGKVKTPLVTVKDAKGNTLEEGTDYTVTYPTSRYKIGKYTVTITYKGNYSGTTNLTYTIGPKNPDTVKATLYGHDDVEFTWSKVEGAKGYKVYYKKSGAASYTTLGTTTGTSYKKADLADNTKYVFKVIAYQTVNGVNCYNAGKTCEITTRLPLSACTTKLLTTSYTYDGKAKTPTVTVTNSSGSKLTKDTHYTVTYSKNTNAGTAVVTIKGKGSYYGTVTKNFTISKQAASKCKASLSSTLYTYDGKAKTPSVTVTNAQGKKLTKDTDYTVTYSSGRTKIGKYTVTIKFKGNYSGTTTLTYTIGPKNPTTVKATLYGHDDVQVTWSKVTGAAGYKVYYKKSTDKSYTTVGTTTATSYKVPNLADGAKYTFKVITYQKVNGNNCYNAGKTVDITMLKKVTGVNATKSGSNVKVSWTDIAGQSGYQISQSTTKDGTSIVATYATTSGTYKNVSATAGKTYYYKVRAYKTEGDKKIYGPWSDVKSYKR